MVRGESKEKKPRRPEDRKATQTLRVEARTGEEISMYTLAYVTTITPFSQPLDVPSVPMGCRKAVNLALHPNYYYHR